MRRPHGRPGNHGGDWDWLEQESADRRIGYLRLVIEGLVPLGVLPWVLSGVKTVVVLSAGARFRVSPATISPQAIVCPGSTHPSSAGVMASALPP
jgi:hypothetical protein